ncbi:MAG: NAD(P)/FAD-dependent oxidoreductase [Halanaerobiales bacterium]|nr:NAD(P)/FAD-dependent oxidoreductase [Halanaerobiales bacterium]
MDADVIIVGSGPAGSYLAYNLAQNDINVLILEKDPWPRYKACGGALSGKTINLLYNDGVHLPDSLIENSIGDFTFRFGYKKTFYFEYPGQEIKLVNRKKFDNYLLKQAYKARADFRDNEKVTDIKISNEKVIVESDKNSYRTSIVVGADGANSKTAQILKLFPEDINKNKGMAIESEIYINNTNYQKQNEIIIDFDFIKEGYAWVFPKKNQLSVGLGTYEFRDNNIKEKLFDYLQKLNISYEKDKLFYRGHPIPAAGFDASNIKIAGKRFILIGDAAFLADPFVGEGIYNACLSAKIAAKNIIKSLDENKYDLISYQKEVKGKLYPQLMISEKLAHWFYSNPAVFQRILSMKPALLDNFMEVIQGKSSYSRLFNLAKSNFVSLVMDKL